MLPWLLGAAAVAIAGAVLSDSSSSSRSHDDGDEQRERLKAQKDAKINKAKEHFKNKWGLRYFKVSEYTPQKIKNLYNKRDNINKDINALNKILKQI